MCRLFPSCGVWAFSAPATNGATSYEKLPKEQDRCSASTAITSAAECQQAASALKLNYTQANAQTHYQYGCSVYGSNQVFFNSNTPSNGGSCSGCQHHSICQESKESRCYIKSTAAAELERSYTSAGWTSGVMNRAGAQRVRRAAVVTMPSWLVMLIISALRASRVVCRGPSSELPPRTVQPMGAHQDRALGRLATEAPALTLHPTPPW